jgi:hypothetical protein
MKYEMRDACFACTTPYQVMGAIAIAQGQELDADLFIFGMFPNYEQLAERLKKYKIFANVYAVDTTDTRAPGRGKAFLQMVFAKKTVSGFLPKNIRYRCFYSTSRALIKTILQSVLKKRNPDMRLVIYEDGMGTYSQDSHILNSTSKKNMAERLLGWKLYEQEKTSMMAYLPQLVDLPAPLQGCHVGQMPRIVWNKDSRTMMADIFNASEDETIDSKCIIFDTLRNMANFGEEAYALLDQCYETVAETVGAENVICKPHPRSRGKTHVDIREYTHQGTPMEVLYAGMEDLQDRILVSHISSAVFTPKIMFDQEPVVICLHRILRDVRVSKLFEGIYGKFKGTYAHQERVMAPESIEELRRMLERLREQ